MKDVHLRDQLAPRSQTCPNCRTTESAGFYCSRCGTQTGQEYWQTRKPPALVMKSHRVSKPRGRTKAVKS